MSKRVTQLCLAAVFTALLAVGSWISVPFAVPFTLQTLALYLALWLLSPPYALCAVAAYLTLGAMGLPIFAGFQGGVSVLFGPLGGFLWGFLLMAVLCLIVRPRKTSARLICLITGTFLCYAVGTVWYAAFVTWTPEGIVTALLTAVVPFILPDALKLLAAWQLGKRLERHMPTP